MSFYSDQPSSRAAIQSKGHGLVFTETRIPGVLIVDPVRFNDSRGFFCRSFSMNDFIERGLHFVMAQSNVGFNSKKGTIRGLHFQREPASEAKLVRCTMGRTHDVIVDIRPGSPSYMKSLAVELTPGNHRSVYIPEGCAHGYQTLCDDTEVTYLLSRAWSPDHEDGLRYDDPRLGIVWPLPVSVISAKDKEWPLK